MGSIFNLFGNSRERFRSWLWGGDTRGLPAQNYEAYVHDAWESNPYARRAIALIAGNAARIPLRAYIVKGDDRERLPDTHPLVKTLRRPNPMYGASRYWERVYQALMIDGDAFSYVAGPDARSGWKAPVQLYNVRPDWVHVKIGSGPIDILDGYEYKPNGVHAADWSVDEVIHLWLPDPINDFDGSAPAGAAWSAIQQSNAAGIHNYSLLKNGGSPRLAWVAKEELTDQQWERSRTEIEEKYTGPNAKGHIIMDAFDVKPVGLTLAESEYIEGVKLTMRQIATTWFIPSVLLNDVENRTHNNLVVSLRILHELNIFPMLDWVCDDLTAWFGAKYGDNIEIDYDSSDVDILQEDKDKQATRVVSLYQSGLITKNEARIELGDPEVPDGDVFDGRPVANAQPIDGNTAAATPFAIASRSIVSEMDALRMPWYRAIEERVSEQFAAEAEAYARAVLNGATPGTIDNAVNAHTAEWDALLRKAYADVGDEFAAWRYKGLQKTASRPVMSTADAVSDWNVEIQSWIANQSGNKVKYITDTTKEELRAVLAAGVDAGDSVETIAANIRQTTLTKSVVRSVVIARTEVLQASALGSRAGAKATKLVLNKHWLSTHDGRSRASHLAAEARYADAGVPLDEPYIVAGYQMMFPGDGSRGAPAEEVIQCRCAETYSEAV